MFFTIAIALGMGGTAIAMVAWITVKNTILWPNFARNGDQSQHVVSLLASFGSMLIAVVPAQVCVGKWL